LRFSPFNRTRDPNAAPSLDAIPSLIKRNTALFASAQALQGSGNQMVTAMGAVMVLQFTGSALLTGTGVTMLQLARIAISYPLGRVADTYGRRPAMLVGLFMGLSGTPIMATSVVYESFFLFALGAFVFGMGVGATQQLRVAVTDMYPAKRRGEALGYLLTGSLLGSIVAPTLVSLAEVLADPLGVDRLAMPWLLTPVVIIPPAFAILFATPDPKYIATHLADFWPGVAENPKPARGKMTFREVLASRPRMTAMACYAPAQGVMSMSMAAMPLVLTSSGHSLTSISWAVTIHVLGMFGFSIPLGRLVDSVGRTKVIWAGLAMSATGGLLMPLTEIYGPITFGGFLFGVGWSAVFVAATAIIADATPVEQRGRAIGLNDTTAALFTIALPLTGGIIADQFGLMAVGIFAAVLTMLPLPLLIRLRETSPGVFADAEQPASA
jgi:MFS family permease